MSIENTRTRVPVDTGIGEDQRRKLAADLGNVLATSYVLYHKIHAYHWNITGPLFYSVHKLTDEHYKDIAQAIDAIAERIRSVGFATSTGLRKYLEDSVVDDVTGTPSATDMIQELAQDHQSIARQMREVVDHAEKINDVYTADLLTARIGAHEEASWMLNALIIDELEAAA